jgi:hypothetical protein
MLIVATGPRQGGRPERARRYPSWRIFAALSIAAPRSTLRGVNSGLHITT